jgi:hypothetical protein
MRPQQEDLAKPPGAINQDLDKTPEAMSPPQENLAPPPEAMSLTK